VIPDQSNGGKALVQDRTKTDSGERAVLLSAPTVAALKRHRDRQKFQRESVGDAWGDHDLVVTTALGEPVNPSNVKRNRARIMAKAGVQATTTHGLRHMAATLMLQAGTSPALVASKIGHKDISQTVNTYGHIKAEDQRSANAAVEAYLARAKKKAV
jgi:integrase